MLLCGGRQVEPALDHHAQYLTMWKNIFQICWLPRAALQVGGRLVYFLPASPETYSDDEVPQHPSLKLFYNIEQLLTARYSRRLIVMEKVGASCCWVN